MTIRQFGERLYHDVERVIADYLEGIAETAIVPAFTQDGTADSGAHFLKTVQKVWYDYTTAIRLILQVLYYLVKSLPKKKLT